MKENLKKFGWSAITPSEKLAEWALIDCEYADAIEKISVFHNCT